MHTVGELILLGIGIYFLATDTQTALWVIGGAFVLFLIAALAGGKNGKKRSSGRPARIDHPHYITEDESECSVCGARFPERRSVCPRCGARFGAAETDEGEWDEEFDEACDMDEEEGW